jgi:hypothetical protein
MPSDSAAGLEIPAWMPSRPHAGALAPHALTRAIAL